MPRPSFRHGGLRHPPTFTTTTTTTTTTVTTMYTDSLPTPFITTCSPSVPYAGRQIKIVWDFWTSDKDHVHGGLACFRFGGRRSAQGQDENEGVFLSAIPGQTPDSDPNSFLPAYATSTKHRPYPSSGKKT